MKTQKILYLMVILIIVIAGFAYICFIKDMREPNSNNNLITEEKSIEIAKEAIKGHMEYDETGKITVEPKEGQYIVTFPVKLPTPTSFGPDYAARVWIDSKTGKVSQVLGGS